jgi:hypothetical protein
LRVSKKSLVLGGNILISVFFIFDGL